MNPKVAARIVAGDDCWTWSGSHRKGYAAFYVGAVDGRNVYVSAHRLVYEAMVGPIPEGRDLHHTCENKGCVNPAHLRPMTDAEHRQEHNDQASLCNNGLHPRVPGGPCLACRKTKWTRENRSRAPRTHGPTETCACGKDVAVGYMSRHARGCRAAVR